MIDRGMEVGDIVWMLDSVKTQLIRRTVNARSNSCSGQPNREAMRMMVPSRGRLVEHTEFHSGCSSKLGCENDNRIFHHTAAFQIFQHARHRLIDTLA